MNGGMKSSSQCLLYIALSRSASPLIGISAIFENKIIECTEFMDNFGFSILCAQVMFYSPEIVHVPIGSFGLICALKAMQMNFEIKELDRKIFKKIPSGLNEALNVIEKYEFAQFSVFGFLNAKNCYLTDFQLIFKNLSDYMQMDMQTVQDLELLDSTGKNKLPVLKAIDFTSTKMGFRLLRQNILKPSKCLQRIQKRHQIVKLLLENDDVTSVLSALIKDIGDLESFLNSLVQIIESQNRNPFLASHICHILISNLKALSKFTNFESFQGSHILDFEKEKTRIEEIIKIASEFIDFNNTNFIPLPCPHIVKNSEDIHLNLSRQILNDNLSDIEELVCEIKSEYPDLEIDMPFHIKKGYQLKITKNEFKKLDKVKIKKIEDLSKDLSIHIEALDRISRNQDNHNTYNGIFSRLLNTMDLSSCNDEQINKFDFSENELNSRNSEISTNYQTDYHKNHNINRNSKKLNKFTSKPKKTSCNSELSNSPPSTSIVTKKLEKQLPKSSLVSLNSSKIKNIKTPKSHFVLPHESCTSDINPLDSFFLPLIRNRKVRVAKENNIFTSEDIKEPSNFSISTNNLSTLSPTLQYSNSQSHRSNINSFQSMSSTLPYTSNDFANAFQATPQSPNPQERLHKEKSKFNSDSANKFTAQIDHKILKSLLFEETPEFSTKRTEKSHNHNPLLKIVSPDTSNETKLIAASHTEKNQNIAHNVFDSTGILSKSVLINKDPNITYQYYKRNMVYKDSQLEKYTEQQPFKIRSRDRSVILTLGSQKSVPEESSLITKTEVSENLLKVNNMNNKSLKTTKTIFKKGGHKSINSIKTSKLDNKNQSLSTEGTIFKKCSHKSMNSIKTLKDNKENESLLLPKTSSDRDITDSINSSKTLMLKNKNCSKKHRELANTNGKNLKNDLNRSIGQYFFYQKNNKLKKDLSESYGLPQDGILNQKMDVYMNSIINSSTFYITQENINSIFLTTIELEKKNFKLLDALNQVFQIQYGYIIKILENIYKEISIFSSIANKIAEIDLCLSFTKFTYQKTTCFPEFSGMILINNNENLLINQKKSVSNNIYSSDLLRFNIISGGNMAGKTTYMKQIAHSVILAQIGCPVPAQYANIKIFDSILTRLNNKDSPEKGLSTFETELIDIKNIMTRATNKSLILLDELGRGTNYPDGLALSISTSKLLLEKGATVFFATHFTELIRAIKHLENVNCIKLVNFHASSGLTTDYFGIQTSKQYLTKSIVELAEEIKKNNFGLQGKEIIDNSKIQLATEILEFVKKNKVEQAIEIVKSALNHKK